jgi:hypothetical protein
MGQHGRRTTMLGESVGAMNPLSPCFDPVRPEWLGHPDFIPVDVEVPDLVGAEDAVVDMNRPEYGADFDSPDFGPRTYLGEWVDEIDEPYDHRPGAGAVVAAHVRGQAIRDSAAAEKLLTRFWRLTNA